MLLRSQSISYFNNRTTAARNKHCEKLTSRRIRTCGLWISSLPFLNRLVSCHFITLTLDICLVLGLPDSFRGMESWRNST